ncbi:uncharacterized protein [Euphorbia lathyris]|uniref:uncharacterized protein isoform X2 n=2 Tax=Euphorbia lathyris TaxID=212925 RepID=UPI0033131525
MHFARIFLCLRSIGLSLQILKPLMDYWRGVLRVPVGSSSTSYCRVAVPSVNAIFFSGDRVEGTRNPVIERLSDLQNIAEILVSKFGASVNAWVIEAPVFNGPFAVYRDFIPSVNRCGEPKFYSAAEFPASTSTISLLSNCLREVKNVMSAKEKGPLSTLLQSPSSEPKTFVLGFSKGGTVLNQLVTELSLSEVKSSTPEHCTSKESSGEVHIVPCSKESLLKSIAEIHYVDVGLNSAGAYITDHNVIESVSKITQGIRFVLHGTPRQWCDRHRVWLCNEKDKLVNLLESAAQRSGGKLKVKIAELCKCQGAIDLTQKLKLIGSELSITCSKRLRYHEKDAFIPKA